jgi:hypothetical protein
VHGTADEYFPVSHAHELHAAAGASSELWTPAGVGHGEKGMTPALLDAVVEWLVARAGTRTESADHATSAARPHRRRWPLSLLSLRFGRARVQRLLEELDEPWDHDRYCSPLRWRRMRQVGHALVQFLVLAVPFLALLTLLTGTVLEIPLHTSKLPLPDYILIPTVVSDIVAVLGYIVYAALGLTNSRSSFIHVCGRLTYILRANVGVNTTLLLKLLGRAGRALFATVLRDRLRLTAPPSVVERARRFALPVLLVRLPEDPRPSLTWDDHRRADLIHFVEDAACVVAISREDLLPAIAERYPDLIGEVADEDEDAAIGRYLDPIGARTRWETAKDFLLPVCSVAIAFAALIISLTR